MNLTNTIAVTIDSIAGHTVIAVVVGTDPLAVNVEDTGTALRVATRV
ncbi:hypothetical protein [Leucobacter denitrificans]|uniref:Uncharacterized protein n=1 Tax=Leucobacter denitrificans TaxID=683042 RepID=A0A7G9S2U7_9MICO|nr:hypothetical protein [Leucobacter denitrificans]QNN62172.1 hypothetical protein H9L06_07685 [Leucobacter denitrificans]